MNTMRFAYRAGFDWFGDICKRGVPKTLMPSLNEHYLHHAISHRLQSPALVGAAGLSFVSKGQIHFEWPSWKEGKKRNKNEKVLVQHGKRHGFGDSTIPVNYTTSKTTKKLGDYLDEKPQTGAAANGAFDLALGPYDHPEVLIEFKWGEPQYESWRDDFMKLLDLRLRAERRIFLGVRTTAPAKGNLKLDAYIVNAISGVSRQSLRSGVTDVHYGATFFDVALSVDKGSDSYTTEQVRKFWVPRGLTVMDLERLAVSGWRVLYRRNWKKK